MVKYMYFHIIYHLRNNMKKINKKTAKNKIKIIKEEWVQKFSKKTNTCFWLNTITGKTSWSRPPGAPAPSYIKTPAHNSTSPSPIIKRSLSSSLKTIESVSKTKKVNKEKSPLSSNQSIKNNMYEDLVNRHKSIMPRNFPKLMDAVDLQKLLLQIKTEDVIVDKHGETAEMRAVFTLKNDAPADFTRAIQEEEILKTRLKNFDKTKKKAVDLPSFWDVWKKPNSKLPELIIGDSDPHEAKWKYAIPNRGNLGYKVATTFMPGYARALYEYFKATKVLDPCAGWGDRLTGAMCARGVEKYVAFDPNKNLRKGYATIMKYGGNYLTDITPSEMHFSNGFEIHSKPFEKGILSFSDELFDFAFTSPPFFDYEMYNPANPEYKDWYDEFYTPLFQQTYRCLKPGSYFGIHIGDTSAGAIMDFLMKKVHLITGFRYDHSIGLKGMMSNKIRTVWMFYKPAELAQ